MRLVRPHASLINVAILTLALIAAACGSNTSTSAGTTPAADNGSTLQLAVDDTGAAASCIVFDPTILAGMPQAFAGTVRAVDGQTVSLSIDRWYAGGDATSATLNAPTGMVGLTGGVDFEVGQNYLITATDGNVNFCGYSGPATPELTAAFAQAFGS
jgi:hypothetical protein